jgi:HEAT repeat protein
MCAAILMKTTVGRETRTRTRDYLLRLVVTTIATAPLVGPAIAQEPDEARAYLPPGKPTEATASEVGHALRLVRQGSGPDRLRLRQDLMRIGADAVPRLIEELESGNHLYSLTAALILGELRDPRALAPLGRVVTGQSRGDALAASLALGRYDDAAAVPPLVVQLLSGKSRESRRAAAFALGRQQRPEATAALVDVARAARQEMDVVATLVALGMSAESSVIAEIAPKLERGGDRGRRAAAVALGLLPPSEECEQLALGLLADEDERVRLAALAALARCASAETAAALSADAAVASHSDDRIRAGVALLVAARGGAATDPFLAGRLADPSEIVRAAAIGGLAAADPPRGTAIVLKGLEESQHAAVRTAAVLALAVGAARRGEALDLSRLFADRDAGVRDAALVAHAWLNGAEARGALVQVVDGRKEDRLVRRARALLQAIEVLPSLSARLLRAELQLLLDDAGMAPSWNVHRLAHEQILLALGLENALPELAGAGAAGEKAVAAAARRVSPRLEDLRRHLDLFPYSDLRPTLEVPLRRGSRDGR